MSALCGTLDLTQMELRIREESMGDYGVEDITD